MAGKGNITSKRASSLKKIRLLDANNENKMAGKENPVVATTILQIFVHFIFIIRVL
jgi:hypothetical protein